MVGEIRDREHPTRQRDKRNGSEEKEYSETAVDGRGVGMGCVRTVHEAQRYGVRQVPWQCERVVSGVQTAGG
jgi:hypothetical protein